MIKIFLLVLSFVLLPHLIYNNNEVSPYMNTLPETYEVHYRHNTLTAYRQDDEYIVIIENFGEPYKQAVFTSDRKCVKTYSISLIPAFHESTHTGTNWDEIQQKFGLPHTDTGSGFYIPTYVTEDAHLVKYIVGAEGIEGITVTDIITKEIVYQE